MLRAETLGTVRHQLKWFGLLGQLGSLLGLRLLLKGCLPVPLALEVNTARAHLTAKWYGGDATDARCEPALDVSRPRESRWIA